MFISIGSDYCYSNLKQRQNPSASPFRKPSARPRGAAFWNLPLSVSRNQTPLCDLSRGRPVVSPVLDCRKPQVKPEGEHEVTLGRPQNKVLIQGQSKSRGQPRNLQAWICRLSWNEKTKWRKSPRRQEVMNLTLCSCFFPARLSNALPGVALGGRVFWPGETPLWSQ